MWCDLQVPVTEIVLRLQTEPAFVNLVILVPIVARSVP